MKKNMVRIVIIVLGLLAILSCNQDPIFFIISNETAPQKPRIEGAPTNMVVFERNETPIMYVASGKLHWYAEIDDPNDPEKKISKWDLTKSDDPKYDYPQYDIPQPTGKNTPHRSGKIISLAVTKDEETGKPGRLFALCMDDMSANATLRYMERDGDKWEDVISEVKDTYPILQSMYTDPDATRLFAGARDRDGGKYAILYLAKDNTLQLLQGETEMLSGVVSQENHYYLCTRGGGIFRVEDVPDTSLTDTIVQLQNTSGENVKNNLMFMNMIKLNASTIIAVERDGGTLYAVNDVSFTRLLYTGGSNDNGSAISTGKYATGALSLWEDYLNDNKKMLIAGIQGGLYSTITSSYTHGYVEFDLNSDNSFNTTSVRRDSGSLGSVLNNDQYSTSLGKRPINHLFQAPRDIDQNMTFFASTQTGGLWSYRDRGSDNGGWQWNAEE
jgi:hypothetical protein